MPAGFSLRHVRFLVIDEADRLLTQSYQDWLPSVLAALETDISVSVASTQSYSMSLQYLLLLFLTFG